MSNLLTSNKGFFLKPCDLVTIRLSFSQMSVIVKQYSLTHSCLFPVRIQLGNVDVLWDGMIHVKGNNPTANHKLQGSVNCCLTPPICKKEWIQMRLENIGVLLTKHDPTSFIHCLGSFTHLT